MAVGVLVNVVVIEGEISAVAEAVAVFVRLSVGVIVALELVATFGLTIAGASELHADKITNAQSITSWMTAFIFNPILV